MKKTVSAFLLTLILLTAVSCAPSPVLKITDSLSSQYSNVTEVCAEPSGDTVIITATEDITQLTVNRMSYDAENDTYTWTETLLSMDNFSRSDALRVILDLKAEVPYIMIKYQKSDGNIFEQYIYKNSYDGKLWLLERENP